MPTDTGWRPVGTAGWLCDKDDGFTLTAWERPGGWAWRCRNAYVAADPRHRNKEGVATTAEAARRAAEDAYAALVPGPARRAPGGPRR